MRPAAAAGRARDRTVLLGHAHVRYLGPTSRRRRHASSLPPSAREARPPLTLRSSPATPRSRSHRPCACRRRTRGRSALPAPSACARRRGTRGHPASARPGPSGFIRQCPPSLSLLPPSAVGLQLLVPQISTRFCSLFYLLLAYCASLLHLAGRRLMSIDPQFPGCLLIFAPNLCFISQPT